MGEQHIAKEMKQYDYVIEVMRNNGGFATLGFLNKNVNTSEWKTRTPYASIRRIVQDERHFFRIRPGLWALNEFKNEVLSKFKIDDPKQECQDAFNHSYYQGLLLEIGNLKGYRTYIPPQDKNKKFLDRPLGSISQLSSILPFSYSEIVSRAKTIDVIWFNDRKMPYSFFEIEHSTDLQNSIIKFIDLQDFYSKFYLVCPINRKREFDRKIGYSAFHNIKERIKFLDYDLISNLHAKSFELSALGSL